MTNNLKIVGIEVEIMVSDPWDFGTEYGTGPFKGKILNAEFNDKFQSDWKIHIRLNNPLIFENTLCEFFIVEPKLENDYFSSFVKGRETSCSMTRIPVEHAKSKNPLDLSWWRGGVGLTGSIRLK